MTDIWLVSDTHFNHGNIIDFCERPFVGPKHMNEVMIENWNSVVKAKDIVWHLGDFGFHSPLNQADKLTSIFFQLKGRKNLLIGNHDEKNAALLRLPWESIDYYKYLKWEGKKYVLSHYPFASWNGANRGVMHFHGHCHGTMDPWKNRLDVGVDCPVSRFFPIKLEVAVKWTEHVNKANEWDKVDHHF